jgi:glycosyltransferase involved in cell wall biosynthesis
MGGGKFLKDKSMVSIVLVTYNRAERLKLSIQDILQQTFQDFELIICDDCSTDATEDICREFITSDSRIKYFRHSSNLRMPANCNFGIQQAQYPCVAILHDGDRFRSDLIEQWYKAISENDSVGFVFNRIGVTDADENLIDSEIFDYSRFKEGVIKKECLLHDIYFRCWRFSSPVYGEAMVRKQLLEEKGFFKKRYGFYADVNFWMDALQTHDAYFCADILITGPAKEVQPRVFDDNPVKYFIYMFYMHLHHRKKAFKFKPVRLAREMIIFWVQALLGFNFWLLAIVKNFSFRYFVALRRLFKWNVLFLGSWAVVLVLYPLLFPFLKLYNVIKRLWSRSEQQRRLDLQMLDK